MPSQWERFKQSNIAKIVIGYSLVVWVLIQLIEAVLPTFETPLWVAQTLTFLLILGFPIALLVGWAYEKLPAKSTDVDGVKSEPQPAHSTPKKTLVFVGIGSCAVIGLFGFYMMPFIFDETSFNNPQSVVRDGTAALNYRSRRTSVMLGATGLRGIHNTRTDIAISPDGTNLAFLNNSNGESELFVKDLRYTDAVRSLGILDITNGSGLPFFSQDGEWLHFINGAKLARVRIEGGSFQTIDNEISALRSGFTSFDQQLIFTNAADWMLYTINPQGGDAMPLPMPSDLDTDLAFSWPRVLPGNHSLLVSTSEGPESVGMGNIQIYGIEDASLTMLIRNAYNASYSSTGHIIFMRDSDLWAVPFDLSSQTLVGAEVPVINGVETNTIYGHATYTVSENGQLFYLPGSDGGLDLQSAEIKLVSPNGSADDIRSGLDSFSNISLSPDGSQLAVRSRDGQGGSDIYVVDLSRETVARRTFNGHSSNPIWSTNGARLFYSDAETGLMSMAANGSDQPSTLFESQRLVRPFSVSPDGLVLFDMANPTRIFTLDPSSSQRGQAEFNAQEINLGPGLVPFHGSRISPDGNWVAYTSSETGQPRLFVTSFPNTDKGKYQVSSQIGLQPLWNMVDNELYFRTFTEQMRVKFEIISTDEDGAADFLEFGTPEPIFSRQLSAGSPTDINAWDFSSSNNRFVTIEPTNAAAAQGDGQFSQSLTNLVALDNWFVELNSLAPPSY